ncbi:MAG: UrcA family protein [Steroidobacteraceae bacterium]
MIRIATKLLLAGGCAVAAASAAVASPADSDVPAVVIHYSTASLATDSGLHTLYRRLEMAAEKVCVIEPVGSRLPDAAVLKCRKEAIAGAIERINNPRLAAMNAANTKST